MRILMVSPHPVYEPRGTPISVYNRCVALCALGHQVDLVTYPIGRDLEVPGLRYLRGRPGRINKVRVGPSLAKIPLNVGVAGRSLGQLVRQRSRYDVIHTHEEAGIVGVVLKALTGLPHVYDMGNDWATVLCNYGLRAGHPITEAAARLERLVVGRSDVVIAHFPAIASSLRAGRIPTPVHTVPNIPLEAPVDGPASEWGDLGSGPASIVYTGTLEPYQGMEILLDGFASLVAGGANAELTIVGGHPDQVANLRRRVADAGLADHVTLTGMVDRSAVPRFLRTADLLVSPRLHGSNTPLKLFSYLAAGKPIVATDIESHTQFLDRTSALLVEPTAAGLAAGLASLLDDPDLIARLAAGAARVAERFDPAAYVRGVACAYREIGLPALSEHQIEQAAATAIRFATPPPSTHDDREVLISQKGASPCR